MIHLFFQGVECFAYSKPLNLLVTGSSDHIVRVWNPYVTSRPVAMLTGHAVGVVDVAIHEPLSLILSYSKDAVSILLFFLSFSIYIIYGYIFFH